MKLLLVALLVLVLVVFGGALLLENSYSIERSRTLAAPPAAVAPYLSDLTTWEDWTAWNSEAIPSLQREFGSIRQGVGASMSWTDEDGSGALTITDVHANGGIDYELTLDYFGEAQSRGTLDLEPLEGNTRVTWTTRGEYGANPLLRYMGFFIDDMLGGELEQGLERLEARVEGS